MGRRPRHWLPASCARLAQQAEGRRRGRVSVDTELQRTGKKPIQQSSQDLHLLFRPVTACGGGQLRVSLSASAEPVKRLQTQAVRGGEAGLPSEGTREGICTFANQNYVCHEEHCMQQTCVYNSVSPVHSSSGCCSDFDFRVLLGNTSSPARDFFSPSKVSWSSYTH